MLLRRFLTWTLLIVFLITSNLTANVQAETTQPQEENQTLTDTTVYLPLVIKPGEDNLPPPTLTNIIDHTTLSLYDQIPSQYLRAAENIRFMFLDRSVGSNINDGMTCLSATTWALSASNCRRHYTSASLTDWKTFTTNDTIIPDVIRFPGGNNRSNITYEFSNGAYWYEDVQYFVTNYPSMINNRDVVSWMPNYLQVGSGSTIATHFFNLHYTGPGYNIRQILELEAAYPNKTFVYYTSSLALNVGSSEATSFNNQMRTWARDNNKILIDVAAILSHTPQGSPCVNNQGSPIICQDYTTESDGGHLGSVSGGKIRVAKAIWILLAQLAGWQG